MFVGHPVQLANLQAPILIFVNLVIAHVLGALDLDKINVRAVEIKLL